MLIADQWEGLAHIDPRARMYLQDFGLWSHITPFIWRIFQPSLKAGRIMAEDRATALVTDRNAVVLHVRRGDTVTQPAGFQPLAPMTYYANALKLFPISAPVIVFSDDIAWCREHLPGLPGDAVRHRQWLYVDHGAGRSHKPRLYARQEAMDWLDMALMAQADNHILSNSTYAWWGAFLSLDRMPVYPSVWWGEKLDYIDSDLMIPDGWRMVEC